MSFSVSLLNNKSEMNRVIKTTESLVELTGTLKDGTSVINPVILVSGDLTSFVNANYMYISTFGRYYFINDIVSVRVNLFEIHAHVDYLCFLSCRFCKIKSPHCLVLKCTTNAD